MNLEEYKKKIANLSVNEQKLRDLYLRDIALGKVQGPPTGYASIDKPWLKYYSEEHILAELPHMTAYEYLKERNKDNLDLVAIDSYERKYTYRELFDAIDATADSLYGLGIMNGNKVMMMLPPSAYESILFYGVDKSGGVISEIPIQSTIDDIIKKINNFDMKIFFVSDFLLTEEMEKKIYENSSVNNIVVIGEKRKNNDKTISWDEFMEYGIGVMLPLRTRNSEDLLFIASTGGSTGEPKSVMLNDNCFNISVHQYLNSNLSYDVGDRWLRLWSLFSATAVVSNNHLPLCAGMNSIVRQFPYNINEFDQMVYKEKSNHLMLIPQLLDVLEKSELLKNEDLSYIKTAGCGGLAISESFEERVVNFLSLHNINTFLGYGWGCTENATSAAMRSSFESSIIGTVGAPQVCTVVSVFDPETMEEKSYGEEGELCIKSHTLMMGYYNDDEMTNLVIRRHKDGNLWLHTGDLGTINEDGIVKVNGRMTRTIFVFPTAKIYPSALENLISKVPGVRDVVVGERVDDEHDGFGLPICFIIPESDEMMNDIAQTIDLVCENCFADYARPQNIYFMEEFPLTKVGKKDVKLLEKKVASVVNNKKIKKLV